MQIALSAEYLRMANLLIITIDFIASHLSEIINRGADLNLLSKSICNSLCNLLDERVIDKLDHKFLNETVLDVPTCENLVVWIWNELENAFPSNVKLQRIKLAETEGNYIAYYGKN